MKANSKSPVFLMYCSPQLVNFLSTENCFLCQHLVIHCCISTLTQAAKHKGCGKTRVMVINILLAVFSYVFSGIRCRFRLGYILC